MIAISNPFDVLSTAMKLKNTSLGIFNRFLADRLY
jgi:hypothetical protein